MVDISLMAIDALTPNRRNARTHSRKQIREIADSIATFGFVVPILVDADGVIIAGHGRYAAAKLLELKQVPTIKVQGLSEGKRRALALADNRIAESAGWDREILMIELQALITSDFNVELPDLRPLRSTCCSTSTAIAKWQKS